MEEYSVGVEANFEMFASSFGPVARLVDVVEVWLTTEPFAANRTKN